MCVTNGRAYPFTVGLYTDPWCHLGGDFVVPWELNTSPVI
jgi:hypothetical protein